MHAGPAWLSGLQPIEPSRLPVAYPISRMICRAISRDFSA